MALERANTRSLVDRLFPAGSPQRLELIRAAWPRAVGPELARRTEVLALEGRTLRVRVPDPGWRKVLHRMQGHVLRRLAAIAGEAVPLRLGLQEGASTPSAALPPAEPRPSAPPPPPPAVAAEAESIADPELRRLFIDACARYLARSTSDSHPQG